MKMAQAAIIPDIPPTELSVLSYGPYQSQTSNDLLNESLGLLHQFWFKDKSICSGIVLRTCIAVDDDVLQSFKMFDCLGAEELFINLEFVVADKSGYVFDPYAFCDFERQQRRIEIIIIKSTALTASSRSFNREK